MFPCPSGLSYMGHFLCIVPEVSFGEGHVSVPGRHGGHESVEGVVGCEQRRYVCGKTCRQVHRSGEKVL